MTWLQHTSDRSKRSLVDTIWCRACRQYEDKIIGMKNFSRVWIDGSSNHKTSNIVDHATSDQHKAAMVQVRRASGEPVTTYSPIARSLLTMDDAVLTRMKQKFDICYVMVKENLPFTKYSALHELELRHGVNLGQAYKIKDSAKLFTHYIARSLRQDFISSPTDSKFYSFLMDGSTDSGNVEEELVVIMFCKRDASVEEVRSCARYFAIQEPKRADANGLIECLGKALEPLGIEDILDKSSVLGVTGKPLLVGGGTLSPGLLGLVGITVTLITRFSLCRHLILPCTCTKRGRGIKFKIKFDRPRCQREARFERSCILLARKTADGRLL